MKHLLATIAALAASFGAQAAPLPCQPQALLAVDSIRERVVLVGEIHGTNEMPAFVSGLACSFLQTGREVVLSLEIPSDVQPEIDRFLASDGGEAARQPLYETSFGKLDDGRGSVAYLGMIEQVRLLRNAGAPISVAATDMARGQFALKPGEKWNPSTRDRFMADNIGALVRGSSSAVLLALAGNLHATRGKGGMVGPNYEPLGHVLAREMPVHSVALAHDGGSAWVCTGVKDGKLQCGKRSIPPLGAGSDGGSGYDRVVKLGRITASAPARTEQREEL